MTDSSYRIFVISGPGGVGKGTIVARLMENDPTLWLSRSWTTRQRRPDESEDAYHFVDRDTFLKKLASNGFIEHNEFLGNLYATPIPEPPEGKDVLLEIEVFGAEQVRARRPDTVVIFVVAPSREVQEQRLRSRGDNEAHIARRLAKATEEEVIGRQMANAIVVNDDLDRAVVEVAGILQRYRSP